ncbi:MAG: TetR/AcrR family transcriptional regulator [Pseudonocardiaceae bacterium]
MRSRKVEDGCRNTSDPEDRARRILDVTAELLTNGDYKRVTVEEIANRAGIGKGTVYLHWKTKEELFGVVLIKDLMNAALELLGVVQENPQAVLLHRVVATHFLGVMRRPLLRALCTRDQEVLGKLTTSPPGSLVDRNRALREMHLRYFDCLARHRLVLADCDGEFVLNAAGAMARGMMMQHRVRPAHSRGSELTAMAKVLAHTVHRAFEPPRRPPQAAVEGAAADVADLLRDFVASCSKFTSVAAGDALCAPRTLLAR